jgi:di/tricarboxylate transporter
MVWAPGNYSFADFFKLGCPLSFIYAVVAIVLIPLIW